LIESRYALTFLLGGSLKFDPRARSSLDLYRLRGGFLGLKPGEKLSFYAIEVTASGSAQEVGVRPCVGKHVLSRDGRLETWTDGKASLFETRPTWKGASGPVQYSQVSEATLLRIPQGAILTYSPRTLYNDCEHLDSGLFTHAFTAAEKAGIGSFVFSEADLRNWSGIQRTKQGAVEAGDARDGVNFKVEFMGSPVPPPGENEMIFVASAAYDAWIPAPLAERMPGISFSPPASKLEITVRIQPKQGGGEARKDKIYFSLEDVTRHKGRCGNYPLNGLEKDDLRFAVEQSSGSVVDGSKDAHTTGEVTEATIAIEATDTAAYGKLTARAPALSLKAIYKPANAYALVVPRDDDGNKIADAWERQMKLGPRRDVMADKDTAPGRDRAGDGLTVFDEYRGLVILENGVKTFKRFNPLVQEVFVVDPSGSFDAALWRQASDVTACKVDETMLAGGADREESRVINFNADDGEHKKYAIRVETMPGDKDPDDPAKQDPSMGQTACGQCRSPKDADYCRVFPYRIRVRFEDLFRWLSVALAKPGSPESQELDASGYPRWLAQRALDKLRDPAAREGLVRQLVTLITIHEVGHAVGLEHHAKGAPKGAEDPVRECPMYYPNDVIYQRFVILQTLFRPDAGLPMRYTKFCRGLAALQGQGFNCYARITVADW